jgi:hypothetical protein
MNLSEIAASAREHADHMRLDLENASTRNEHMRLTQLAFEADRLAYQLEQLVLVGVPA